MRNWHPFIKDVVAARSEADRVAAICLAPQFSELSVGLYMKRTVEAAPALPLSWATSYHDEPLLIEAFAERLRPLLPRPGALHRPQPAREGAGQRRPVRARMPRHGRGRGRARRALESYDFAFQSQGMTGDKWLGPTVESCLDRYAAEGVREVVIDPIGFVCDHVEILYDIDIGFRDYAAERGITIRRPESLNGSADASRAALAEVATAMPRRIRAQDGHHRRRHLRPLHRVLSLERRRPSTIVESRPRLGGVIQTEQVDGCTLEAGPDSFLSAKPAALDLIRELGLADEVIGSNDHLRVTYVRKNGRLVPLPDGLMMMVPTKILPLVTTPLL